MRFDKLTIKSQEALQDAQSQAEKREHQQVEPEHLLYSLLDQAGGSYLLSLKSSAPTLQP